MSDTYDLSAEGAVGVFVETAALTAAVAMTAAELAMRSASLLVSLASMESSDSVDSSSNGSSMAMESAPSA